MLRRDQRDNIGTLTRLRSPYVKLNLNRSYTSSFLYPQLR